MNHLPDSKPVVFVAIIFVVLLSYSFLADALHLPGTKHNNFIADITIKKEPPKSITARNRSASVFLQKDTGNNFIPLRDYANYDGIITYEAQRSFALTKFITALKELKAGKRKKVRIAYFGDSMIEGDLISGDFRRQLQDSFGGTGVGFVPVTSVVSGFRETILHSYSNNWMDKSYATSPRSLLFLSGHSFFSDSFSTVQYGAANLPHLQQFAQVNLLYGKGNGPLDINVNGKAFHLPATGSCNKTVVAENCTTVKAKGVNGVPLYGFSFEDTAGVYVDNYAFRGSSGMDLGNYSADFLKQIQKVHDYDLIIFQYGPNLFKPKLDDFTWYEKPMTAVMEKFKTAFPNASLLVISTADKAYRYEGEMETAVGVEPLLEAQNNFSAAAGVNLWNLYHAMGGRNSMINWVEGDTALARKDYTHFTYKGAQHIAAMLFTAMMKEYDLAK